MGMDVCVRLGREKRSSLLGTSSCWFVKGVGDGEVIYLGEDV
jgi:hypothetical protein